MWQLLLYFLYVFYVFLITSFFISGVGVAVGRGAEVGVGVGLAFAIKLGSSNKLLCWQNLLFYEKKVSKNSWNR